jgi:hypothetical protein
LCNILCSIFFYNTTVCVCRYYEMHLIGSKVYVMVMVVFFWAIDLINFVFVSYFIKHLFTLYTHIIY